jgi:hypothetical protein
MARTWEQLTQAEKIEDLRQDVKRIFDALRSLSSDVDLLSHLVSEVAEKQRSRERNTRAQGPNQP